MKDGIHPQYFDDARVVCACGNTFTTGSTKQTIRVELCNKCHPFYTGQQKLVDTMGRVEKFQKKQAMAREQLAQKKAKKDKEREDQKPRTLKEMIAAVRNGQN